MADAESHRRAPWRLFWQLSAELISASPGRSWAALVLTLVLSATEGAGLLLLMPLLNMVGVEEPNTMPRVSGWLAEAFRLTGFEPTLGGVLLLFVGISGCRALLQKWQLSLIAAIQESFTSSLRVGLYQAIAGAEWKYLVTRRPAEFTHFLAGEIARVGSAASHILNLAGLLAVTAVYVGLAVHLSASVALLVLGCAAILAWAVRGTLDDARRAGARAARARNLLHGAIAEQMSSMKVAKSYDAIDRHAEVFASLSHELRDVNLEVTAGENELQQSLEFGSTAFLACIVFVSLGVLDVPAAPMLVLLFVFSRLMPRLVAVYRRTQTLVGLLPVFGAVRHLEMECKEAAEAVPKPGPAVEFTSAVRFDGVSFRYVGRQSPAVRGLTLEIASGRTTGIVGPSGSGKSTVADLLTGLLVPTEGRVLVDGVQLQSDQLANWRRQISYVPQDTFLFHDTVRANLAWARPGASDVDIWHALRSAAADRFVAGLPHGLDTIVGERGVMVSGGERQRLSLARALLRNPRVLILDEATSALDSENELRIQQAIEHLHRQLTIVVITHRLATIRQADTIYVLDGGTAVESGTWDDLIGRASGRFRALCGAQGLDDTSAGLAVGQWARTP